MEVPVTLTGGRVNISYRSGAGWSAELTDVGNSSNITCNPLLDMVMNDSKILQLLGIAFGAWVAQILLFLIIRCCAPDYSRAALATSKQWVTAMYNRQKDAVLGSMDNRTKTWSTLLYEDKHWYTWIINFFWKLKLSDIQRRCGPDASVYLSLELYLVLLLALISLLSLGVILPINYTAGRLSNHADVFPRTTIANVPSDSGVLWVHTAFSLVYLCLAILFMVHFSLRLGKLQRDYSNHTVMVQWIPPLVHREDLMQHLQEALPDAPVNDIQMAYDVAEITSLSNKLKKVSERMEEVDSVKSELGVRETVLIGWRKLFCCTDRFEMDARSYLEGEYSRLKSAVKAEKRRVRNRKKLGMAFITFKREQDAKDFYTSYKLCRPRPQSSLYHSINAQWWWVHMAPFTLDIICLSALAELALDGEVAIEEKLQCVFLPNNGGFFVSYAMIAVFVRTGLDLLRLPELLLYLVWRGRAKTRRQRESALNKAADFNFLYGVHYAWNLVLFNLVMSFSLTTPVITPLGMLYFIIKYYVDRYNIYYVYKPAPFQGRQFIHRSAVNFVIVGAVHLQLFTLFFSIVRLGRVDPRSVLMMVTFTLTCTLCIGAMFFGWFKHLLPQLRIKLGKEYRVFGETRSGNEEENVSGDGESDALAKGSYIPPVLREGPPTLSADNSEVGYGYQSFGSTDMMGRRNPGQEFSPRPSDVVASIMRSTNQMSTLERSARGKGKGEGVFGEGGKYLV